MTTPTTRPPRLNSTKRQAMPRYHGAGLTHVGRVREINEDAILTDPEMGTLWAIADGMGGYGHGDVASDIVTQQLAQIEEDAAPIPGLRSSLLQANQLIQNRSAEPGMSRMGATVVAVMLKNAVAHIAWAGDCRAYLMRQGHLKLLTRDHTVVQDLVEQGLLATKDSENHPDAHIVTRAIGYEHNVEIDALSVPIIPNDLLLLCSDGLAACLGDQEIVSILRRETGEATMCESLVQATLEKGAPDNLSVICIGVRPGPTLVPGPASGTGP